MRAKSKRFQITRDICKLYLHLQQSKLSVFYLATEGTVRDYLCLSIFCCTFCGNFWKAFWRQKHHSFWCLWKRVAVAIVDQFQSFYAFESDAREYIPSHFNDVLHQKLENFLIVEIQSQLVLFYHVKTLTQLCLHLTCIKHCRSAQIAVCANGCVIFLEREPNSFLKILSSSEFSKILVSGNSERESELIQKFTIKRLCFFSACWERLRRHICPSRVWVRFLLLYLN